MPEIIIIAAIAKDDVIGYKDTIPWKCPEDMTHFKELTTGQTIVMGTNTWRSLPRKPLPNRKNIVMSRSTDLSPYPGVPVARTVAGAIAECETPRLFVIGGEQIYRTWMPYADALMLTFINKAVEGDTYFPWEGVAEQFSLTTKWIGEPQEYWKKSEDRDFMFCDYKRVVTKQLI